MGMARALAAYEAMGGYRLADKFIDEMEEISPRDIQRVASLGFDVQLGPANLSQLLDALAAECVTATFFLVGHNAEALPFLVKREVADGHTVAHHTFSHPARTLRRLSEQAAQKEILRGFEADDKAAYGTASGAPKVRFFRFPGFADTPALVAWLSAKNIAVFGADFWASDWVTMTPETELALILSRLDEERRGILLLHDTKQQTAAMLPALLNELKTRGYKIVNIVSGTNPAPTRAAPEGWTSETEKIIADLFAKARAAKEGPKAAPKGGTSGAASQASEPGKAPSPK